MERLTIKGSRQYTYCTARDSEEVIKRKRLEDKRYEKLSQLEDIEDELGINLITLFKLSKAKNVCAYGYNKIIQCSLISVNFEEIIVWNGITKTHYPLCNYGISFALTKEELENDK